MTRLFIRKRRLLPLPQLTLLQQLLLLLLLVLHDYDHDCEITIGAFQCSQCQTREALTLEQPGTTRKAEGRNLKAAGKVPDHRCCLPGCHRTFKLGQNRLHFQGSDCATTVERRAPIPLKITRQHKLPDVQAYVHVHILRMTVVHINLRSHTVTTCRLMKQSLCQAHE